MTNTLRNQNSFFSSEKTDFTDFADFTDFTDFADFADFTDFADFADFTDFGKGVFTLFHLSRSWFVTAKQGIPKGEVSLYH